ncbi:hypothetical protein [Kitasatospora sp. NPDC085879]|uniref:hypothetical protein n=1 Tax=Kitasatospora sp. NPDC085879 TaxID=3154769 RepID=UPI00343D98B3
MRVVRTVLVTCVVGGAVFAVLSWLGQGDAVRGIAGPAVVGVCCGLAAATKARK